MKVLAILALVLTAVLWYLYHRFFTVIYTNIVAGFLREIVVCFVLAVVIVGIIASAFGFNSDSKEPKDDKSSSQQTASPQGSSQQQGSSFSQGSSIKDFYGSFYNTALLHNGVFDTLVMIGDSEESRGDLHLFGYAAAIGVNYLQAFDIDIPMPAEDTFTCQSDEYKIALTITLHPEDHTLEIVQEPITADGVTPFTGSYVDSEAWNGLADEVRAATERIMGLSASLPTSTPEATPEPTPEQPNPWIDSYEGQYVLEAFVEGEEGVPFARFNILPNGDGTTFSFSPGWGTYRIPFPLGEQSDRHIEYVTDDGLVAFDVLDDKADGRHVIRVIASPNLECTGVFVSGAENLDPSYITYNIRLNWPGDYFCQSGGADGTKSMSVTQVSDQLLSIDLVHNYADGRVETYHAEALINAYRVGMYYALSDSGDKWIDFKLQKDEATGQTVIVVQQNGINPSIDPEFIGTYFRT